GAGTKRAQDAEGNILSLEHVSRSGNKLQTNSFEDGLVILNNDFSLGRPEILEDLDQNVLPPTELGWHTRRKSRHFTIFNALVEDLAAICSFDPWFLKCEFLAVDGVNFVNSVGLETSSQAVDVVLNKISEKYAEYNLSEVPFVMMKDDSGTFGYGVQSIHSGDEILQMGAKTRKKFAVGKQKKPITSLLIQEGIPTSFSIDDQAAEPVIYSVGGHLVGGFMRIHPFQGARGNLNSRGMFFGPLLDSPLTRPILSQEWKIFSLYNILNKLGNLAISYEQAELTASRRQI
ncbi:MAG TPA: glutamate--cysteine ligase, partial [Candidatus Lokiarchaeia archaeon]|nr:glutamate--cysteine ligase [Candidatus Lokiarchaeia archaeon]